MSPDGASAPQGSGGDGRPGAPCPHVDGPAFAGGRAAHMVDTGTHRTGGVDASRAALSAPAGRYSRLAHTPLAGTRSPSGPMTPVAAHLHARFYQPTHSPSSVPV